MWYCGNLDLESEQNTVRKDLSDSIFNYTLGGKKKVD